MKRCKLTSLFLFFCLAFGIFNCLLMINVDASSFVIENWESYNVGKVNGLDANINWTRISGNHGIISNSVANFSKSLYLYTDTNDGSVEHDNVWINFTTDYDYINSISIKMVSYLTALSTTSISHRYSFYNDTLVEKARVTYYTDSDASLLRWVVFRDFFGVEHTIKTYTTATSTYEVLKLSHVVDNLVNYSILDFNGNLVTGLTNTSLTSDDWNTIKYIHITAIDVNSGVHSIISQYLDDISISTDLSSTTSVCDNSLLTYADINHDYAKDVPIITDSLSQSFLEIRGIQTISAKIDGFALLIGTVAYGQLNLSEYLLYLNNVYVGSASCFAIYDPFSLYLVWDIRDLSFHLTNELPIFELVHVTSDSIKWRLKAQDMAFNPFQPEYSTIDSQYGKWDSSHIDGVFDNDDINRHHRLKWRMFYSELDLNETNPNYTNSIAIVDSSGSPLVQKYGMPSTYMFTTVFLQTYVDTINKYTVYVTKSGINYGFPSFPRNISTYSSSIGFTPLSSGNYTISLKYGSSFVLNQSLHVDYLDPSYAIFTDPNPSNSLATVRVGVYVSNTSDYLKYKLCMFGNEININIPEKADMSINILPTSFNDSFYYFYSTIPSYSGRGYLRLFATDDDFYVPITSVYIQFISLFFSESSIGTNLLNGVGYINEQFRVYGIYNSPLTTAKVFMGSVEVYTLPLSGIFGFPYTFTEGGTYAFYLKELQGGSYVTIATVTVSIVDRTSSGNQITDFLNSIPLPIKIGIGLFLTLIITLLPLIVGVLLSHHQVDMPNMIYVAFFFLGLGVSCGIGLLNWALFFVILLGLIIYFVVQWQQNKG